MRVYNTGLAMKAKARHTRKRQLNFEIFTTLPSGRARHIASAENLAAARKRLKQISGSASGDCFIYSEKNNIVELIVRSELQKPHPAMHSSQIIRGKLAS